MKKRILSWLLVLCMVLTLLPVSAFAEDEPTVFVAFQPDMDYGLGGKWVSFGESVNEDEKTLLESDQIVNAAECVNGMVYMQLEDGNLYGTTYEELLAGKAEPTLITALDADYSDFAYSYADGRLYAMYSMSDEYGNETHVDAISLEADDYTEAYEVEPDVAMQNNMVGYTLACDDDGALYILGATEDENWELGETAHLWKFVEGEYSFLGTDLGDTTIAADYSQSAAWDHNTETLYWARFNVEDTGSFFPDTYAELYRVDPGNAACTEVGKLSGETQALLIPLTDAAQATHPNVPETDVNAPGQPVLLTKNLTLSVGSSETLRVSFDPWYTSHKNVTWKSSNDAVATVVNGVVTARSAGSAIITVASADDPTLTDTCAVAVASLSVELSGYVSYSAGEPYDASDSRMFTYRLDKSIPTVTLGDPLTAEDEFAGFGLKIAASEQVGDTVWADEWGNTGMLYGVDAKTGAVQQMFEPIDGDMLYGLSYSEKTGRFTGIMNTYMVVDMPLPLSAQDIQDMLDSQVPDTTEFNWHKLDMQTFLDASQGDLVTPELGMGSTASIVLCGITNIPGTAQENYESAFGYDNYSYTADVTWVLLDNVGRIWYVDEITGMTSDGEGGYIRNDGEEYVYPATWGDTGVAVQTYADSSSVFVVREIVETPLYDTFLSDGASYTYHFSDFYYAGEIAIADEGSEAETSPMFFLALYDYWGNASHSEFYLYVQNRENTGTWDSDWNAVYTKGSLYDLGNLGNGYMIATINRAEYVGGLLGELCNGTEITDIRIGDVAAVKGEDGNWTAELPYDAELPKAEDIQVTADPHATSEVTAAETAGVFTITVTAENGDKAQCTLTVTIAEDPRSSDTGIESITVGDVAAAKGEDGNWTAELPYDAEMPDAKGITVALHDSKATCEVTGPVDGVFTITVTAENGDKAQCTLTVTIAEDPRSTDTGIESITVGGVAAAKGEDGSWTAELPHDTEMPKAEDVAVATKDSKATSKVTGPVDGVFTITVTAENGDEASCTLRVTIQPCPSAQFTDVDTARWYHEAVDYALDNGLMNGMEHNTFQPDSETSRAMLVTILWRHAGSPKEGENVFDDVQAGRYYTDAIAWAAKNDIVNGVGDNRFDPEAAVTREQAVTILYRYAAYCKREVSAKGELSAFPDADSVGKFAQDAMRWAVSEGIINGSDGKLLPKDAIKRAEISAILMRFIEEK